MTEMSEMQVVALAEKFSCLTADEQRIALRYFDTTLVLEEMSIRLKTIQDKLNAINQLSSL